MNKINKLFYLIGQGFLGLWRNKIFSIASILTLTACLFIIGLFRMLTVNISHMLAEVETNISVTVFFEEEATEEDIQSLIKRAGYVFDFDDVVYVSGEEAWVMYKNKFLNEELTKSFGEDNPLEDSESVAFYLVDVGRQDDLIKFLEKEPIVRQINNSETIAKSFDELMVMITWGSAVFIIVLAGISVFLICLTVATGVNTRRNEIAIMNLIGATDRFIKAPYICEGFVIGIIGVMMPLLLLNRMYGSLSEYLTSHFGTIFHQVSLLPAKATMGKMIPIMMVVALFISILGSYFAASLQIRKINMAG